MSIIIKNKSNERKLSDYTLEELRSKLAELTKENTRQHGKKGIINEDPAAEWKRLYNNVSSIISRNRRRKLEKLQDQAFEETYNFRADDADTYGIRPWQERRYKSLFKNCTPGSHVHRKYLITMTALTLHQIYMLQKKTGLSPVPPVKEKEAMADKKYREYNAIYL